jgi:two-component system chemotaxis response regulator CheB
MASRDIVTIGASAGGVEALMTIARTLPADLQAAVFIVLHMPPDGFSVLPTLLRRVGPLPASHPTDGDPIRRGQIYVAPPDHHLTLHDGHVRLVRGPRENRSRPSVDPLMRSAAQHYGPRAIGVILSGSLDDGTAGLLALKRRGGVAIVQDPKDALFPGMPASAMSVVKVDHCLPLSSIGPTIARLVTEPIEETEVAGMSSRNDRLNYENRASEADLTAIEQNDKPGIPSPFACPDCGGVLWEVENGSMLRFRCRVGHAYSVESLLASQTDGLEGALWSAMRALEEKASLTRRLADRATEQAQHGAAQRFAEQSAAAEEHASTIRTVLLSESQGAATSQSDTAGQDAAGNGHLAGGSP